jgi:hypothetical protein
LEEKLLTEKAKEAESSHSVINADEKVPNLVWFSPATTRPSVSRKLKCDAHTVYIFDKGYNDYKALNILPSKKQVLLLE